MLGIWEVNEEQFKTNHFAFHIPYEDLLQAINLLNEKGISVRRSFGLEPTEPIVHAWMPAASVYFYDPNGNSLEYIAVLEGESYPELGALYLSVWKKIMKEKGKRDEDQ
ncbi:VOC family protein [Ectobacillus panaciterrae]|uniref:VOC family protein n=1 Tax=Ectobacillus panaciterrae TaxID=363872 RepID=UPI00040488B4|nr:VOC family protein [Ectobacillus panaciterrae]